MLIKQTKEMTEAERLAAENSNNQYLQALSYVAVGTIYPFAGEKVPDTFMLCDGSALDVTEYAELFDVIGYSYGGEGDTFHLPDLMSLTQLYKVSNFIIKVCQGVCTGISGDTSVVFLGGDATSTFDVEIVVDHELSAASDNPVSNKAVTILLRAAQNDIKNLQENVRIIESGISGIWTYRVWSDGTAECWGRMWYQENLTALTPFVVDPNYIYDTNFPYPFIDEPCVTATITNCINIYQMLCDLNYTTQQINSFAVFASASMENAEGLVAVYAKGKVELGG